MKKLSFALCVLLGATSIMGCRTAGFHRGAGIAQSSPPAMTNAAALQSTNSASVRTAGVEPGDLDLTAKAVAYEEPAAQVFEPLPIDLATSLQLAGASNWSVQLARERVQEAQAKYREASFMWLPSLMVGVGYNGHEGRLQNTEGDVINASRHSLFVGGGASVGNSPIAGGSGGPFRMGIDLSLADTIFEPLARCQQVKMQQARAESVFNDTLMDTGVAYYELLRAEAGILVAQANLADAEQLVNTTEKFVDAGAGANADNLRAKVIEQDRLQKLISATGRRLQASARLAQLLQMDPDRLNSVCGLTVFDKIPVPVDVVGTGYDLQGLIAHAHQSRPELTELVAKVGFAQQQLAQSVWRPALPNVFVGGSAGGFGGGEGRDLPNLDGRGDLDVIVAWQIKNLGLGDQASQQGRKSQKRQAEYELAQVRDRIAAEVSEAYFEVELQREQLSLSQQNIDNAQSSMEANVALIRDLEGMPLELIQAINSLAVARESYLNNVVDYNQAQLRLLRAVGMNGNSAPAH